MKAVVITPTFNERGNIPRILESINRTVKGIKNWHIELLVDDDNSPDGTGEIADRIATENPRVHVIHRPGKQGLGQAYITGFKYALEKSYDLIFEMDADFSHDPKYIKDFLETISEADLVLGSRYLNGVNVVNWPISRLLLSWFANLYVRWITGLPVRDTTGGFKCFKKEILQNINLDKIHSNGYSFQIEMTFRAWKKGFKIKEIPIIFIDRRSGHSKMSKKIMWEAIWMVWRLRLSSLLGKL